MLFAIIALVSTQTTWAFRRSLKMFRNGTKDITDQLDLFTKETS